jgi:hypothetical protein
MDKEQEIEFIVGTLIGKGYDGFVMSRGPSVGKLKEVVEDYLKGHIENKVGDYEGLWFSTYVLWNGEEKPHVACDMWMKMKDGLMVVDKMIIDKKGDYGTLIKRIELKNLFLGEIPTTKEAIELVNEARDNKMAPAKKGKLRL